MRTLPLFASALALTAFAACGDDSGSSGSDAPHADSPHGSDGHGSDAGGSDSGGSDGGGGQHITVSGTTDTVNGTSEEALPGATVTAYMQSDDSQIATTTSDANGAFSLDVPYSGTPVAIYLKGTATGDIDSYLYPPAPLSADLPNTPMLIISSQTEQLLLLAAGSSHTAGTGLIGLEVLDSTGNPVEGATISSNPAGTYRYDQSAGFPGGASVTSTFSDGRAYDINVPAGTVTINADKTGMTFAPTTLKARADVLTLTSVVGQ